VFIRLRVHGSAEQQHPEANEQHNTEAGKQWHPLHTKALCVGVEIGGRQRTASAVSSTA
jgi:hypothetical protein